MKSLHFVAAGGTGGLVASELPLRMPQASGVIDPEPFRAQARGEVPALADVFALSAGMRTLHVDPARPVALFDWPGPLLTFVISGEVRAATASGIFTLQPGDLFLVDGAAGAEGAFETAGDCRLVQLRVEPDWPGDRARPPRAGSPHPRGARGANFKRMFKGADEKSYFRGFDALFTNRGIWSDVTPLVGFRFIGMAEGTFIDWHPEVVNNFVIVLSGALELEVGGGTGAVEIFRQGDVCLAEDRTGEGHIDRVHGDVQVAVLIIADAHLWP